MSVPEPQRAPQDGGAEPAGDAARTISEWRVATAAWRSRVTVLPAVGTQPTRVFIDLSKLEGVEIPRFRLIQTDPPLAESLFVLANNPSATEAFTRIARSAADHTDALATQLELVGVDSSKACLLASELRKHSVIATPTHIALFDDVEVLSRRLEAKVRGKEHPQELTPPSRPMPTQTVAAGSGFYDLALSTLDDAKSLIAFRRNRGAHPEWEALLRTMPPHLTAPVAEWRQAQQDDSIARHELDEARGGRFCNEWIEPMRRDRDGTLRALEARVERAGVRLRDAAQATNDTQTERSLAENDVAAAWLRERGAAFKVRFDSYVAALADREQAIEAERNGAYVLRGWKDSCACTVLREIGRVLMEVEDPRERESDWWGTYCLAERFNDLDEAAWKDLRIDVKQEAARLETRPARQSLPHASGMLSDGPGPLFKNRNDPSTPERAGEPASRVLGNGGPAKVLARVCRAIRSAKADAPPVSGDRVALKVALHGIKGDERKKAGDYLAPSGRLVVGGWVRRDGESVVITDAGVRDGMARLAREERR